ncbi:MULTISPECIES: hypothetical protein [unclassified Legionella]|uniref:hypothetical protein n=1 Tax=unclassified Legionella TaxID=2622702 RepID=UPI0010555926|nr:MULTISPECIES: hypothetical protein [unclassified Legionella]MDI9819892.1 hypothetical protein [Legionella sp. PL877]
MIKLPHLLLIGGIITASNPLLAVTPDDEIKDLVKFLVSKELLISSKEGKPVPLSYYIGKQDDIDRYFGDYICQASDTCAVIDSLYNNPYAILGQGLNNPGNSLEIDRAQAQIERTDMKYGADIYDAATWQIALALAAKNGYLNPETAKSLINNQLQTITNKSNRATDKSFKYGYKNSISNPKEAFTFRMITTEFHNKDPFYKGKYQDSIGWDYDPDELAKNDKEHHDADFFKYVTTWSDWKPITGENAWAQLIGPLQAELLLNNGKVSSNSLALQNAMNSLNAFSAMQAGIGAFYYAPGGSQGNQGPIPKGEISVENNFSVLGGLQILKRVLQSTDQTAEVKEALRKVDTMLYGGTTVNGYKTLGILSFIYNGAYNRKQKIFYTHGTAVNPSSTNDWKPDQSDSAGAMAIDINTWGISALGAENIDRWYGKGTALKMWQQIREKGGYYSQGELWGVGYTLQNNAGKNPEQIMSAEWTAGAINTLNSLIQFYQSNGMDTSSLENDLDSMKQGIVHLRNDQYLKASFDGATPEAYFMKLPAESGKAYLYASKRFAIPFGWNANTLPSTTSNAWVIMNKLNYNPFQYAGQLGSENYPTPEAVNISEDQSPTVDLLPKDVTVTFNAGDLGKISHLSLSYFLENDESNWITSAVIDNREGQGFLPAGVKTISIAYDNQGWAGACQISPATKICKDSSCDALYSIAASWSADGKGECELID